METPRKFITSKLSIRKPRSSSMLIICDLFNELEHLRNVLKMNGYPRHFIDYAMKTPQSTQRKIEYQSSVCLPYIDSHKFSRKMRESIEIEKHNTIDQEGKPLDSTWPALFNGQN